MLVDRSDQDRDVGQPLRGVLESALPDDQDAPPELGKVPLVACISPDIFIEFCLPEGWASRRRGRVVTAGVAMPETAMDKDGQPVSWQHQVWRAREILAMKPKAKALCVKKSTQLHLWGGIPAPDATHHPRACGVVDNIRHMPSSLAISLHYIQVID